MNTYRNCVKAILELNPPLRGHQRKKLTTFWVKFALIELVTVAATVYMMTFGVKIAPVLGVILAVVLPILLLKPQKFFGTRKMGRITKIAHERRQVYNPKGNTYASMRDVTILDCFAEDEKGDAFHFEVPKRYVKVYHEGDDVVGLAGLPYPIVLTPHPWILCPLCGGIMPQVNATCVECGAERIKLFDTSVTD